jgi:hypothetical protein
MIIRSTKKLLNISRIKVKKDVGPLTDKLPGEWYASIVSMGLPGKGAIHFLHVPTLISAIIPGKSLNRALTELPSHAAALLKRQGYSKLLAEYQLDTKPEIRATNSRSVLAYMNDMRYNIEYHLSRNELIEEIEDIEFRNLFGGKLGGVDYITPKEILDKYLRAISA